MPTSEFLRNIEQHNFKQHDIEWHNFKQLNFKQLPFEQQKTALLHDIIDLSWSIHSY